MNRRLGLALDAGLALAALGIVAILVLRAAVSIDTYHDTWWYHLPWAARLSGLLPADAYVYDALTEQRFAGFPMLVEWIQGQLWRLTGRPESVNFVGLGGLLLFVVFLRLRFCVPLRLAVLGLVAIPLVQIHATCAYVDLAPNLALTAAILLLPGLYSAQPRSRGDAALFAILCIVVANARMQLWPVVSLVAVAGLVGLVLARRRRGPETAAPSEIAKFLLPVMLVAGAILYHPIRNTVLFGNPVYPIALRTGVVQLDGPEDRHVSHSERLERLLASRRAVERPQDDPGLAADGREQGPAPGQGAMPHSAAGRWLASVLELGMEPVLGNGTWNVASAQDPPLPARYGGFFGWYVLFNLALFAALVAYQAKKGGGLEAAAPAALLVAAGVLTALMPRQEILRYYLYWMLLLVALNLVMMQRAGPDSTPAKGAQRLFGSVGLLAFLAVVYATRAELVQPRFYVLEDLIEARRSAELLAQVERHSMTCLVGERAPRVILYSRLFNPGKAYRLKMGPLAGDRAEEVADACGESWTPVIAERADAGLLPSGQ